MSSDTPQEEVVAPVTEVRLFGRVKWFNMKAGYGFITIAKDQNHPETDTFVHHSSIVVEKEQYKYLVQGEYVEFTLTTMSNATEKHKVQAARVCGIKSGKLMCETRNEVRATAPNVHASPQNYNYHSPQPPPHPQWDYSYYGQPQPPLRYYPRRGAPPMGRGGGGGRGRGGAGAGAAPINREPETPRQGSVPFSYKSAVTNGSF
jgi:cold shock CspA family protein